MTISHQKFALKNSDIPAYKPIHHPLYIPPIISASKEKTYFFQYIAGVSKSVPQKHTVYPKISIYYKELDHTGTLSFILPIGQITFFHFFSIYFYKILLSLFFYRLIKKISSFNHFVIDKIVPNDNLNSSFIDKKVLDFFSPLKQIFFHLLSGNI